LEGQKEGKERELAAIQERYETQLQKKDGELDEKRKMYQ